MAGPGRMTSQECTWEPEAEDVPAEELMQDTSISPEEIRVQEARLQGIKEGRELAHQEYHLECAMTDDPWIHRSAGLRCETCLWFIVKESTRPTRPDPRGKIGRCRRRAPSMNGYPVVFQTDWCGDHKLDEEKL